jgi:acyl-CoA synthetase (AMP-forming)/AMP-acid ligase II
VVPRAGAPTVEELRALLAPALAAYKLPEELRVLDRIPRNRNGKVDYPALRAAALASGRRGDRTRPP